MNVLLSVGLTLLGTVAVLSGVAGLLSPHWRVERSIVIDAPPAVIYPLIANLKSGWSAWNPWQDPSMNVSFTGPDEGVGATQNWKGGDTNGGTIRITKADSREGVEFALTFGPFPIDGRLALSADGVGRTRVVWTDSGKIAGLPIYRFMRFMITRFVGAPMEQGLARLKQRAEALQTS